MSFFYLLFCLIFPRGTLFVSWLLFSLPNNDTPFWLEALGFLFLPRVLIAYWAYQLDASFIWIALLLWAEYKEKEQSSKRIDHDDE